MAETPTPTIVPAEFELTEYTDVQLRKLADKAREAALAPGVLIETVHAKTAEIEAIQAELDRRTTEAQAGLADQAVADAQADLPEIAPAATDTAPEGDEGADDGTEGSDDEAATAEVVVPDDASSIVFDELPPAVQELVKAATAKMHVAAAAVVAANGGVSTGQAAADQSTAPETDDTRPVFASAMDFRQTGGAGLPMGVEAGLADIVTALKVKTPTPTDGKVILASARIEVDDDKKLTGDAQVNGRKIVANLANLRMAMRDGFAQTMEAKLAGICAPPTTLREPRIAGSDATPVSDLFAWLTGESGNALSYQYRRALSLAGVEDGVSVWTSADQEYVDPSDPDTWKPIAEILCPDYTTVEAEELIAGFQTDSWVDLSSPEVAGEFARKISQLQARQRDGWVLRALRRHAHLLTYGPVVSGYPDVVAAIEFAKYYATYTERLDSIDYVTILPPDLVKLLVVDDFRRGNHTDPGKSEEEVLAELSHVTGGRVVAARDFAIDADGTLPDPAYPDISATEGSVTDSVYTLGTPAAIPTPWVDGTTQKYPIHVVDPTSFQPFTTGEATFGQQVTLDQARQNKRGLFMREFVGMMKPGVQPNFEVTVIVEPTGMRAGLVTGLTGA